MYELGSFQNGHLVPSVDNCSEDHHAVGTQH